jgi:DNA repair protein RecN (Recombination protein N)
MLTRLTIRNIVLIQATELLFGKGLTVLTGETGAGKSILLDALGLVLGNRAEARLIRSGEDNAQVSAEFDVSDHAELHQLLEEHGIERENSLIIRRQLKADGSSKAWVNDQPVTLKLLKDLGERLVIIHGQHGQKGLMEVGQHAAYLDAYAVNERWLQTVSHAYRQWREAQDRHHALHQELVNAERERDYLEHMVKELATLAPEVGEEEELVSKRTTLMQAEKSGAVLRHISDALNGSQPIAEALRQIQVALVRSPIAEKAEGQTMIEALERAQNEIGEAESALATMIREDVYDERALEQVEERLFLLREMARKHRVTVDDLAFTLVNATQKLTTLHHGTAKLQRVNAEMATAKAAYHTAATHLRERRLSAVAGLEAAVHCELAPLKMEATRFRVTCTEKPESAWAENGMDEIRFEVSTNAGSPFAPLATIASGGELSRFMLSLAVVLKPSHDAPMLIFDEIDTGTGGAVADAIGGRLAALATHQQVCVVTHLPQVAARGSAHLFIEKRTREGHTVTSVVTLDDTARREELARMLSGATITEEARHAARRLLAV